jgi:hypothetical protein
MGKRIGAQCALNIPALQFASLQSRIALHFQSKACHLAIIFVFSRSRDYKTIIKTTRTGASASVPGWRDGLGSHALVFF